MPLDNAKLERAVNTTEKLVKRMDAFEAKRKDAHSYGHAPAARYLEKQKEELKYLEKEGEGNGERSTELRRRIKEMSRSSQGRKDAFGSARPAQYLGKQKEELKYLEQEGEGKGERATELRRRIKEMSRSSQGTRGDDYGHPVKTRDNRVQETGRMDASKSIKGKQEQLFQEALKHAGNHTPTQKTPEKKSDGGMGKKSTTKYEDPGNKSESDIEWEAERASIKHGGRAKNPYEPGSKAHGIWGKAHG